MKIINSKFNFSSFVIAICVILILFNTSRKIVPPNVVMIIADDLGWSQLGCYGSTFYKTPNIDKLAKSGIKFTNAYSAASICSPTRAAIMTGKYPARLDLTDFIPGNNPKNEPLLTPQDWQKYLPLKVLHQLELKLKPLIQLQHQRKPSKNSLHSQDYYVQFFG